MPDKTRQLSEPATSSHAQPQGSALTKFLSFVGDYRELLGYIVGFGAAPVILDLVFAIGPPWPHPTGIAAFTSVVAWLVLFYSYTMWNHVKHILYERLIQVVVPISFGCMLGYIALTASFVYDAPDHRHRVAGGFILKPGATKILEANPGLDLRDILETAEYHATRVWVEWTARLVQCGLLMSWLLFFGSLSFVVAIFTLHEHYKNEQRRKQT